MRDATLASELVAALLAQPLRFKVVRLRAAGHDSAALYEALAFTPVVAADATHKLEIS